jgi:hypothetical protein
MRCTDRLRKYTGLGLRASGAPEQELLGVIRETNGAIQTY